MATEKERLEYIVDAQTKGFEIAIKAVGVLAVAAFSAAVKVAAEFEKTLSKLRAVSGGTAKQMDSLEKQSRQLGRSTAFTANEVAGLQVELAKLGFTSDQILKSSGGVLDLAAGLGTTLSDAAILTGSSIRAFGLQTKDTGRVVDVFAHAAASSALDFNKLTEGLKNAAPIARATGRTIEETVALLGTLANAGIVGGKAGTDLRKIFSKLNEEGLSLNDAYDLVNNSSDKLGTAMDLVGERAKGALLVLANGIEPTKKLAKELNNAEGAAEKMRITMEDNLRGDWDKFVSATTDLGITLGNSTNPHLRTLLQHLTDIAAVISDELDFKEFLKSIEDFGDVTFKAGMSGKSYEEAISEVLTTKGKKGLEDLQKLKREYDRFYIDAISDEQQPTGFITDSAKQDLIDYFKDLGVEVSMADLSATKFQKTYKSLLSQLVNNNIATTKDSGDSSGSGGTGGEDDPIIQQARDTIGSVLASSLGSELTTYQQAAQWQADARKILEAFGEAWGIEIEGLGDIIAPSGEEVGKALRKIVGKAKPEIEEVGNELGQALQSSLTGAFVGIGQAIGDALSGNENFGDSFLKLLGEFMQQFGAALIGIGVAEIALKSKNPGLMIAGGIALVVAGSLLSNAYSNKPSLASGNSTSTSTATTTTPSSIQGIGQGGQLVATVRGQDLRFVLQGANDSYGALS